MTIYREKTLKLFDVPESLYEDSQFARFKMDPIICILHNEDETSQSQPNLHHCHHCHHHHTRKTRRRKSYHFTSPTSTAALMVKLGFPDQDLYQTLGVSATASLEEIRKAYRDLCRKVHPDKAGNTQENNDRFAQVQEAWEILRDEVLRKEYDQHRAGGGGGKKKPKKDNRSDKRQQTGYGAKPNRNRRPYYEEWGDAPPRPDGPGGYRQGGGPYGGFPGGASYTGGYAGWGGPPPGAQPRGPFGGGSPPRGPPPPPHPGPRGGAHSPSLQDRILLMRMQVDADKLGEEVDSLRSGFESFVKSFTEQYKTFPTSEQRRWRDMFNGIYEALNHVEDLYEDICDKMEDIEAGTAEVNAPAMQSLGEQIAFVGGLLTMMRYAAMASSVILNRLVSQVSSAEERQLFEDLEVRLRIFGGPFLRK
ncbi:hypothetical protein M426DRAFT_318369 [Hypoxylon sp. CI-4A]|nr:hypothetical protein M426DRAFT_318369 [Hypoxylon sp. CI-4A]